MNRLIRSLQLISAKLLFVLGAILAGRGLFVIGEQINMGFFIAQPMKIEVVISLIIGVVCLATAVKVKRLILFKEH